MDGVQPQDIISSLSIKENRDKMFKAGEGAGASGSFFFFSNDNRFIIKTLQRTEMDKFLDMLPDYAKHIAKTKN
jgi:1-phosphatidylinositol-4-phosphate 5-kinase